MLLYFDNGDPYACGVTPYVYRPVNDKDVSPRIILTILIEGLQTQAFVDTGGIFVIAPQVAHQLRLDPTSGLPAPELSLRGSLITGVFHRVLLTLLASEGDSLAIEATAFVPNLAPDQEWVEDFPCILGMNNCFERLRFAVDPTADMFYFGELAGDY